MTDETESSRVNGFDLWLCLLQVSGIVLGGYWRRTKRAAETAARGYTQGTICAYVLSTSTTATVADTTPHMQGFVWYARPSSKGVPVRGASAALKGAYP